MDLVQRLRVTPLFQHLSDEGLERIESIAKEHQVPARTTLCRQADLGATFFLIDHGEAIAERVDDKGFLRPVRVLRDGDAFGINSLFFAEPRDATVITRTPMRLWTIQREDFQGLLDRFPALYDEVNLPSSVDVKQRMPEFDWLGRTEHVVHFVHRHWLSLVRGISVPSILVIFFALAVSLATRSGALTADLRVLYVLVGGAYLTFLTWHWIDWINDYFVVTTQRISHRERLVLLYESRSEVPIDRVQNINVLFVGLGAYLGFGTMVIETASETGTLVFNDIPDPEGMRQAIWDQAERALATQRATERRLMTETLANHLGLDIDEGLPHELGPGEGLPSERMEPSPQKEGEPSTAQLALAWLQSIRLLPATRIESPERVIWRKHVFFLLCRIAIPLTLAVVLLPLTLLSQVGFAAGLLAVTPWIAPLGLVLAIAALLWFVWEYVDWGNDQYIVTNERIIDVEKSPMALRSERREASLGVIQNVSFRVPHFWASLLNYGCVLVQTAGRGDFTFDHVGNPAGVQDEIFRRIEAYRERQRQQEAANHRREMADWFAIYDELGKRVHATAEDGDAEAKVEPRASREADGPPWRDSDVDQDTRPSRL